MSTSIEAIARFLDNRGWKYELDREKPSITTGVSAKNVNRFVILMRLSENGEFLQLIAPQLLHIKDHVYKGVAFQTMLHISYQTKMLKFEYDPSDGEVRASIELPLEDTTLTERQFNRCLEGLVSLVDKSTMPRLKAVLETGEDLGQKQMAERLVDEMPPEMLQMLGQMAEIIQQRLQG